MSWFINQMIDVYTDQLSWSTEVPQQLRVDLDRLWSERRLQQAYLLGPKYDSLRSLSKGAGALDFAMSFQLLSLATSKMSVVRMACLGT